VPDVVVESLKCMQDLLEHGRYDVGKALFPFYGQILSMFNVFHSWRQNLGDHIDYNQKSKVDIGDLVSLECFTTFHLECTCSDYYGLK
jgi:hypothetical protein